MSLKMIFRIGMLLLTSIFANAYAAKGCIAIFQGTRPISVEVELPKFEGGLFQTKQFQFANLPNVL